MNWLGAPWYKTYTKFLHEDGIAKADFLVAERILSSLTVIAGGSTGLVTEEKVCQHTLDTYPEAIWRAHLLNANDLKAFIAAAIHELNTISDEGFDGPSGRKQGASRDEKRRLRAEC